MNDEKAVVKRKSKYKIQSYLNQNREMVIQARLNGQVRRWMKEYEMWSETVESTVEQPLVIVETDANQLIDLKAYRSERMRSYLVNNYLTVDLALTMLALDILWILVSQIYLSWSSANTFQHIFPQVLIALLSVHLIFCILIYVSEKRKQYKEYMAHKEVCTL